MNEKRKIELSNKIYGWMLEALTEFVQENTDEDEFEEVYSMVLDKFSK